MNLLNQNWRILVVDSHPFHRQHILRKLGTNNLAALTRCAIRRGLMLV